MPRTDPSRTKHVSICMWKVPFFSLGVLGGQLQLSETRLIQRNAVSIFLCIHRKTNCDFQHRRSNNILVTANYTAHKYIKGSGVILRSFFLDLESASGFHA